MTDELFVRRMKPETRRKILAVSAVVVVVVWNNVHEEKILNFWERKLNPNQKIKLFEEEVQGDTLIHKYINSIMDGS